jgi:alkaline phosphatase D
MDPIRAHDRLLERLSRRELLKIAGTAGLAAIAQPIVSSRTIAQPLFATYPFTLGVASGDPLPDGVVLWTRLAPGPLDGGGMPMTNVEVFWEIAADDRFVKVIRRGSELARPELGHSVHVEASGLEPNREYWYRFRAGGEVSQIGRTRTAPASGATTDRLRFAVCGCSHYEAGYFSAYRRIAEEHFDFIVHTGDYIYEGRADGGRNPNVVRQHRGQELYSLVDYRNRYAQYKSDPDLMAAHASAPFIVTFDDHEVDNDYAGDQDEQGTPPELFLLRRAAAYQAYYETRPLRRAAIPTGSKMRLHRRLQFGKLIDFSILDTRQYRSKQPCGGGSKPACAESLDPNRTILGAEQEKWLFENVAEGRSTWTVIGQQVPSFARDMQTVNPSARFSMDKWDGYVGSRNRLYARLKETRAPNPIVLSGDVHQHYASDLKLDFTNPDSETVGAEFTNTSITSGGDGTDVSPAWERAKADNPHVKYHSARRGYIACTATPAAMRADFKIVEKVTAPDQPVRLGGSVIVESGRPGAGTI